MKEYINITTGQGLFAEHALQCAIHVKIHEISELGV